MLQNICDSIRVCLRDPLDLKTNQTQHLLTALLHIILHFGHYGHNLSLAASRCLVNVLNKHPDRIQVFLGWDIQGYNILTAVIQNDEATNALNPTMEEAESKESQHTSSLSYKSDSKDSSERKDDESSRGCDLSLVSYCVRVLYMTLCQSEDAHRKLRANVLIIRSALHRLSRCVLNNHVDKIETSSPLDLSRFPFTESNANLFIDLCKLLYILDAFPALEEQAHFQNEVLVHPSSLLIDHIVSEHVRFKHLFRQAEVQSVDEISIRWDQQQRQSATSLDNAPSFTLSVGNSSGTSEKNPTGSDLVWNPLTGLPALELLQSILLIILSISPIYLQLQYRPDQDIHQNNYYVGKLADCEDCALQLLLLASDVNLCKLFDAKGSSSSQSMLAVHSMKTRRKSLANSFVRILNRTLLNLNQIEPAERCAVLTPILVRMTVCTVVDSLEICTCLVVVIQL